MRQRDVEARRVELLPALPPAVRRARAGVASETLPLKNQHFSEILEASVRVS